MDLAYWISPSGKVMKPTMYHIGSIIDNPKKFGETDEKIKDVFDKHGEPVTGNAEGKARDEIILRVMKRGFIRIRKYNLRHAQNWSIEMFKMTVKRYLIVAKWAKWLIDNKMTRDTYADVLMFDLGNKKRLDTDLHTLFLEEGVKMSKRGSHTVYTITLSDLANIDENIDLNFDGVSSWPDITDKIDIFLC